MAKKNPENTRKKIEKDLREQVKARGADIELYRDLIQDYLSLWDLKESLKQDIIDNGLRCEYSTATGTVERDNPSAKQLPIVNRQMLATLRELGISTGEILNDGSGGGKYVAL